MGYEYINHTGYLIALALKGLSFVQPQERSSTPIDVSQQLLMEAIETGTVELGEFTQHWA